MAGTTGQITSSNDIYQLVENIFTRLREMTTNQNKKALNLLEMIVCENIDDIARDLRDKNTGNGDEDTTSSVISTLQDLISYLTSSYGAIKAEFDRKYMLLGLSVTEDELNITDISEFEDGALGISRTDRPHIATCIQYSRAEGRPAIFVTFDHGLLSKRNILERKFTPEGFGITSPFYAFARSS